MLLSFGISFTVAWLRLNPLWLTLSIVAVTLVPYLIKRHNFYQDHQDQMPPREKRTAYLRYLMYAGLPLAISSIFISVQVKAAQMFLAGTAPARDLRAVCGGEYHFRLMDFYPGGAHHLLLH